MFNFPKWKILKYYLDHETLQYVTEQQIALAETVLPVTMCFSQKSTQFNWSPEYNEHKIYLCTTLTHNRTGYSKHTWLEIHLRVKYLKKLC